MASSRISRAEVETGSRLTTTLASVDLGSRKPLRADQFLCHFLQGKAGTETDIGPRRRSALVSEGGPYFRVVAGRHRTPNI